MTKPNTPKLHPNLTTHPKLCYKPKHKYHEKYSTSMLKTNKNHNKLRRARPTGLANIENEKQKKTKEKNSKTKTYQKTKTTTNTPRHRPSNASYQQRPINSITPFPMRFEILLYFSNTNIYATLQPQYTSYAKKDIPSKNKETRLHPSVIYTPTTKSVLYNTRYHHTKHGTLQCPKYHIKYKYYLTLYTHKNNTQTKYNTHPKCKPPKFILHPKYRPHKKYKLHQKYRFHPIYKMYPKHTYFLSKQFGNITPATTNPLTATKHGLIKHQKINKTKPKTPKPHPNLKLHLKLCFKPKLTRTKKNSKQNKIDSPKQNNKNQENHKQTQTTKTTKNNHNNKNKTSLQTNDQIKQTN